ncbi:unnamed protein product [Pieris macdunnoughi]|uniref:Caveolin n=2 Tax=Pieris TaxID=7115 RepID=A0A821XV01_9NEOP|nr:unnamed protein product [Pieris macdunnoughi]
MNGCYIFHWFLKVPGRFPQLYFFAKPEIPIKLLPDIPEPGSQPALHGDSPIRVQVMESTKTQNVTVEELLEDRDPNNLNQHVQLLWDDVIGEPEGGRSPESAWRVSRFCFKQSRRCCYTVLSILLAPPCALVLGCGFACLAFEQIWCATPGLRCLRVYCFSIRSLCQSLLAATVTPTMESIGHLCKHIRVNMRKDAPEEKDLLII